MCCVIRNGRRSGPGSSLADRRVLARPGFLALSTERVFAVMRRLGIDRAASLDRDFAIFRFGPNRRQAFAIIR